MSIVAGLFGRRGAKTSSCEPLLIEIFDPFESLTTFTPLTMSPLTTVATTRLDWKETPEAHVFVADIPGLKKEEVRVEVEEERFLKISGQRTKKNEEKSEKWHRMERSSDLFSRSVRLPPNANPDRAKAVLENGTLTVTVPKEEAKAKGRFIEIAD